MRVLIVINYSYPVGPAGANRVQKLARGLRLAGDEVSILAERVSPPCPEGCGQDSHGIPYQQALPACQGRVNKLVRFVRLRKVYVERLRGLAASRGIEAVVLYGSSWAYFQPLLSLCRERGIPGVLNVDEWFRIRSCVRFDPFFWDYPLTFNPFFWDHQLMYRRILHWVDGTIAISRHWFGYCTSRGIPTLHVPAMSDPDVSAAPRRPPGKPFVLGCLGGLAARDLPLATVKGIHLAVSQGLDVRLVVLGRTATTGPGGLAVQQVQSDPLLQKAVVLTGWLSDQQLQEQLWSADALLLLRRDDWESRACFPTRLPEYLMTGRPVMLSAVGDAAYFFRHRDNAWLLPPGDRPAEMVEGIRHLAAHPQEAERIGQAGRRTAMEKLSYVTHGQQLHQFLAELAVRARRRGARHAS
jgi:glycosyltransferase involved in cell wall biosynthesis